MQELQQTDEHVSDPQHKKTPGKGPPHQSQALLWLGLEQPQAFPNPQASALRPEGQRVCHFSISLWAGHSTPTPCPESSISVT